MSLADARETGEAVEAIVADAVDPLRRVPDDAAEWHDLDACAPLDGSEAEWLRLGGVAVVERHTAVECKAARVSTSNGSRETPGRWYIRAGQHEQLVDADATYILAVYEGVSDDLSVVSALLVPAVLLDELLLQRSWYEGHSGEVCKLSWTTLLDPTRRSPP